MQAQANWESHLLDLAGHFPHSSPKPFFSYWAGDTQLHTSCQKDA